MRVGIHTRVSTHDQKTLPMQLEKMKEYIEHRGWTLIADGISESSELHKLSELGLAELELEYKESKLTDEFGNQFRYRAKVKDVRGSRISRWAWDVFLVKGSSTFRIVNPKNNKFKGLIAQWETLSKLVQPFNFLISDLVYTKSVGRCRQNSLVKAIY